MSGFVCIWFSRCFLMTPHKRNGEGDKPNRALVNRRVIFSFVSMFLYQWSRIKSRSSVRILTWRNACFISSINATGWSFLSPAPSTNDSEGVDRSVNIHSRTVLYHYHVADPSYTILSLVISEWLLNHWFMGQLCRELPFLPGPLTLPPTVSE